MYSRTSATPGGASTESFEDSERPTATAASECRRAKALTCESKVVIK